jgi:hypothetical protein
MEPQIHRSFALSSRLPLPRGWHRECKNRTRRSEILKNSNRYSKEQQA